MFKRFNNFLCFLREVFGDAFQKCAHDILLVSTLIQLRDVDPMVATLTRGISEAQARAQCWNLFIDSNPTSATVTGCGEISAIYEASPTPPPVTEMRARAFDIQFV